MKRLLLLIFVFAALPAIAQKQAWNWHFGQKHALDFSKGDPVYKTGGVTRDGASYGTVSDSAGRLLFYTDYPHIYAADHSIMQNGDSVIGDGVGYHSTLIVPKPGSSSLFYVFSTEALSAFGSTIPAKLRGFRYSLVDMCLNAGRGGVVAGQKFIKVRDSIADRIAACADAAGTGYWIVTHEPVGNRYFSWYLSSSGLSTTPVVSAVGSNLNPDKMHSGFGNLQLSPVGTQLAMAIPCDDPDVIFELCSFNNSTGVVSKPVTINLAPTITTGVISNIAFAPQGRMLYVATVRNLFQFDASASNAAGIVSSKQLIWGRARINADFRGLQLGPDGKLYFNTAEPGMPHKNTIGRIQKPDVQGTGCDLDSNYLLLPTTTPTNRDLAMNFPSFVAGLRYRNAVPCVNAASVPSSRQSAFTVGPNPATSSVTVRSGNPSMPAARYFQLSDVSGRILQHISLQEAVTGVDLRSLAPGMYFYRILEDGISVQSGKLMRE